MWPFSAPDQVRLRQLLARIETLEDGYERLERRFVRLQGEFSALNKSLVSDEEEETYG